MARNISIAMSAKDGMSSTINTIRNSCKHFSKDAEELERNLDTLNATKCVLKIDADDAKRKLKDAEKAYIQLGTAASKSEMLTANAKYEGARRSLNAVSKEAKQAEKDMMNFGNTYSKTENKMSGMPSLIQGIAAAGIGEMAGNTMMSAANAFVGSGYGKETASIFGGAASGAASGAGMGFMIGNASLIPGAGIIGAGIGAAAGGLLGGISGGIQNYQNKDDSFRSMVQDQYGGIEQKGEESLANGLGIASQREMDKISFSKLIRGEMSSSDFLADIKTMANTTPFQYGDLTNLSKALAPAYGDDPKKILEIIKNIGDAGATVGIDTSGMGMIATSMSRMRSTGKTSLENLNIMQDRGIDVYGFLADGMGKTKEEVLEMVSKGLIPGAEAAQMISDGMNSAYEGAMELQGQTHTGLESTIKGLKDDLDAAMGEAYANKIKPDQQSEIDFLGNKDLEAGFAKIGEWKADMEIKKNEIYRDTMNSAMEGTEYQAAIEEDAKDGGARAGEILARAQIDAEVAWKNTDGFDLLYNTETNVINGIQEALAKDGIYTKFGHDRGVEFSKGIAAAIKETNPFEAATQDYLNYRSLISDPSIGGLPFQPGMTMSPSGGVPPGRAFGMTYIPRDDYLARLHEGERVLTASEARAFKQGAPPVTITGNSFTVREEADIYKIAQALADELNRAQMIS